MRASAVEYSHRPGIDLVDEPAVRRNRAGEMGRRSIGSSPAPIERPFPLRAATIPSRGPPRSISTRLGSLRYGRAFNACKTIGDPVAIDVTLSNGNTTDIAHSPDDWRLPISAWTPSNDPVIPAAGDGADGQPAGNQVASAILAQDPPLFVYLGDVYTQGSYAEMLNHYGGNSLDGAPGSRWGH